MEKVEIDIDGKLISLEAGDLARQAGGAVVIRQGDTMVLVTATMAKEAREGIDFFPPRSPPPFTQTTITGLMVPD